MPVFLQATHQKSVYKANPKDRTPQAPPLPPPTQSASTASTRSSPTRTPKYLFIPCRHSCTPERRLRIRTRYSQPRSTSSRRAFRTATSHRPPGRSPALGSRMGGVVPGRSSPRRPLRSSSTMLCCSQHTTRCRAMVRHSGGGKQSGELNSQEVRVPSGCPSRLHAVTSVFLPLPATPRSMVETMSERFGLSDASLIG